MYTEAFLENIKLFLEKKGWHRKETKFTGLVFYCNDLYKDINIILPKNINNLDSEHKINDALNLIALMDEIELHVLKNLMYNFDKDLHNYRVPGANIESVSLLLAEEILTTSRKIIYYTAQTVYDKMKDSFRNEKRSKYNISNSYVEKCSFAHTWRGSFGFTIETPLNLPSIGLFEDTPENYERMISKKIFDGMRIVTQAEENKSANFIVDNSEIGFNAKMLSSLMEIAECVQFRDLEYSTSWSPAIKVQEGYSDKKRFILNNNTFQYIEKALSQLGNEDDQEYEVVFYGFPEGFKSHKEKLLDSDSFGDRFIFVRGFSDNLKTTTLKMELKLEDYLNAVRAHENHADVKVRCRIKKKFRGWEVTQVLSFEVLEN